MKTVSLELAKQLKSAGFPQESEFWYKKILTSDKLPSLIHLNKVEVELAKIASYKSGLSANYCSSPTADEILDHLPDRIVADEAMCFDLNIWSNPSYPRWVVSYWWDEDTRRKSGMDNKNISDNSLADAAAKMWLYLKNNNLLKGV